MREGRTLDGPRHRAGIAIEAIVPSYLWRFRKTGQFRHRPLRLDRHLSRARARSGRASRRSRATRRTARSRGARRSRGTSSPRKAGDERADEADRDQEHVVAPLICAQFLIQVERESARPWSAWRGRTRIPPPSACRRRTAWPRRWSRPSATRRGSWRGIGRADAEIHRQRELRSRRGSAASRSSWSTHSRTAPPTISMKQTIQTLNSTSLMKECAAAPIDRGRQERDQHADDEAARALGSENAPMKMRHSLPK